MAPSSAAPRPRRWVVPAATVLLVLGSSAASARPVGSAWGGFVPVVLLVAAVAAVAAAGRLPRSAAAVATAVFAIGCAVVGLVVPYYIALLVTLFSVALRTDRRTAIISGVLAVLVTAPAAVLLLPAEWSGERASVQLVAFIGFAVAAGDATRSRRTEIASLRERTRRAEETAEARAQQRVAEERVRIARDLHDAMAHQIAVINLHASVASQTKRHGGDPEPSLATIRQAARTVLGEMGSLLTVLRAGDAEPPVVPVPSVDMIGELVEQFQVSGLRTEVRQTGQWTPLSEHSSMVAYRVVQEALTNAQKHGSTTSALLELDWTDGGLNVTVINPVNPGGSGRAAESGYGLVGVRERLHTIGGTFSSRRGPGLVHRFTARIPTGDTLPPERQVALSSTDGPQ